MKKLIVPAILLIIFGLTLSSAAFAQSKSSGKSSKKAKKMSSKQLKKMELAEKKEMEEREKKIKAGYDPVANKKAQEGETFKPPMKYYGESPSLNELAEQKKNQEPLGDDKGKLEESDQEPILEDTSEPVDVLTPSTPTQIEPEKPLAATLQSSFESLGTGLPGFTLTGAPPDTTMAVGPDHIVAWVNSQYAVFNKAGVVQTGPVNGNTLFTGLGNVCETTNRGDPILQYDRRADRWFLSQFAFDSSSTGPFLQCIAVSTTGDPSGTYYRYTIDFNGVGFNDYGKLGIWTDAYYTSYNIFNTASSNIGVSLCASDRTKMLAGDATATSLCAPVGFYGGGASFLPADNEGDLPTDNRGGVFMRYSTTRNLRLLRLKPDFAAGTVTLTDGYGGAAGSFINFPVGASTTLPCNGTGGTCIAQPETTTTLDTLGTRLMYRLVYRNRGGVESLMVTQSVDPDSAGTQNAAIRWYEIRNPLGNPADPFTGRRPYLYQNGTYNPGASGDRWMGSMGMNRFGDILLGYSYVNTTLATPLKPSIAVAARSQLDALNTLQTESIAVTGTGSQTVRTNGMALTRWGDYSTTQTDPADEETFWYTTEYLATNGVFNWRTRVVSYKFPTTTAIGGAFNVPASWTNGVPNTTTSGIIPNGVTMTVNAATTIGNLFIEDGGNLVMNADLNVSGSLTLGNTPVNTGANTLGLGCQGSVSDASATTYIIGNIRKDFCQTQAFVYPTGTANGYSPAEVNVTALATNPSSLTVTAVQGNRPGMDPAQSAQRYWTLTETGDLTADLFFNYLQSDVIGTESNYKLFKWQGATAAAITPFTLDTAANTISTNGISDFSDWAIGNLAPTAASVTVSGKVVSSRGRAASRTIIRITDKQGNTRTATTNQFGYFRFDDIEVGETYVVSAFSKVASFTPQVITVNESITNLVLSALSSPDQRIPGKP